MICQIFENFELNVTTREAMLHHASCSCSAVEQVFSQASQENRNYKTQRKFHETGEINKPT